jgi:hypothetical protein
VPRYYFHLISQHRTIPDHDGVEVTDLAEAYAVAREAVEEFRRETPTRTLEGWRLEATDASGGVVFSISLKEFLH